MYYHEKTKTWYNTNTKEDILAIIKECLSPDIAAITDELFSDYTLEQSISMMEIEFLKHNDKKLRLMKLQQTPESDSNYAHKTRAAAKIHRKHYETGKETPYYKYNCPICETSDIRINLTPPNVATDGPYTNCPCCQIRLDWTEVLDLPNADNT